MEIENIFSNFSNSINFYVNSDFKKEVKNIDPKTNVLTYLRENGYTGTKYGCGEGGCGACTVVIAEYNEQTKLINYRSANSCLLPLCSMNNKQIITIEGLGNLEKPHLIQKRFADGHSSQCGFCTPGIIMSFFALLKLNPSPSLNDIEESFDGNLCRCTGYRPILDSAKTFASQTISENFCFTKCSNVCNSNSNLLNEYKVYDPSLDIPFPIELIVNSRIQPIYLSYDKSLWIEPCDLSDLLKVVNAYPSAKIVGGNTEVGVEMALRAVDYSILINISNIKDTKSIKIVEISNNQNVLEIGANITLTSLIDNLKKIKSKNTEKYQNVLFDAFLSNLRWFASRQIRNFATLAGNIVTGSPISDLNPILVANDAKLTLLSEADGQREIPIREFYKGYRKNVMKPNEILLKVSIPLLKSSLEYTRSYKQGKRKEDDIAIVNACFRLKLIRTSENDFKIDDISISFGGLAPTTLYLAKLSESLKGLVWGNQENLELVRKEILKEVNFAYSVPGGMPSYRRCLAISFFTRFWYQSIKDLKIEKPECDPSFLYNLEEIEREVSSGKQDLGNIDNKDWAIGTINPHVSALKQTTGTAKYLDDIPKQNGELYASLVLSSKAHALIKKIDASKALELPGVHGFFTHEDIKHNVFGPIRKDEEFFASKEVLFVGQTIGVIAADTKKIAKHAASLVKIEYEPLEEIISIDDAIEKNSFFNFDRTIQSGEFNSETFKCDENDEDLVFKGEFHVGGQEHFYLETHSCLVIPKGEDNELEIYSSTQNPTETQREVAHVLGLPFNRVVCKVKRIGGGFGGKETRSVNLAVAVALAAKNLGRPVRCVLERDIDMLTTGQRHPFYGSYKLRCSKNGQFKAYELDLISNAGHSFDLSTSIVERAMTHCDNVYKFPNLRVRGRLAKTNLASNTAFRGFGGPQGMMITEMMISEVSEKLNIDQVEIRRKNFYGPNERTHYDMPLNDWFLPEMWDQIIDYTNFKEKRKNIDDFNNKNKWKKRGLAITPTKFGISFTARFLNQAGALVHILTDGSVLLSHGGVEMGQGLNTKMIQIAANTLQIPIDNIYIAETSTDKVANTSATAASASSDLNGMAVMYACNELSQRLKPYREKNPNGNMSDWAMAAYLDRINLSANGFYKTPDLTYDWETNSGNLFFYFTTGIAVSSVELDVLTGDSTILETDIIMDIGNSINYSIDIGQIEGAFIQGVGWSTIEELLVLTSNSSLLTKGPGNYKIPSFRDIPIKFNVKILRDKTYSNLKTIKSSKGVGEPPLFLGANVFFALRDAVIAARKSNNVNEPLIWFPSPCTPDVLRLACQDNLSIMSKVDKKQIYNEKTQKYDYERLWSIRP